MSRYKISCRCKTCCIFKHLIA